MKKFFQKLSSIGTPEWRLASLFLWWGVFHFTWMLLLLWTNSDQVMSTGFVVIVSWLVTGLLLLLTHINSLTFRPMRKTRILLWMASIAMLGVWLLQPFLKMDYFSFGRERLFFAFLAQFIADVMHIGSEWHEANNSVRIKLRQRILIGFAFALLPLASMAYPVFLTYFHLRAYEAYGNELGVLRRMSSPMEEQTILKDWDDFKKTEEELKNSWRNGEYNEVLSKWNELQKYTADKWWLERRRLRLLPFLLREGIPDDVSLCQYIQSELQKAELAMRPLEREYILWNSDETRQAIFKSGPFGDDEFCVAPIVLMHFRHYAAPMTSVPYGVERLWRSLVLRLVDEFYQLKLQSLDTSLEQMDRLETQFDHWLKSIPWNYELFAPNTKCMDGVGVHINRYYDLYAMFEWQATCRQAIVGVALHQCKLQHGEWPEALEQLVPSFLHQLPCDPYTNGPLRVATHPVLSNAVTVYSERKMGTDEPRDANLRKGFPVREM